jgi:hypothetical protein
MVSQHVEVWQLCGQAAVAIARGLHATSAHTLLTALVCKHFCRLQVRKAVGLGLWVGWL